MFVGQAGAAVAADVEQRPDDAVVAAHDDDRSTGDVVREVIAGFSNVTAQGHEQWHLQEDLLDLVGVLGSGPRTLEAGTFIGASHMSGSPDSTLARSRSSSSSNTTSSVAHAAVNAIVRPRR